MNRYNKANVYNLGEFKFNTLNKLTKEELLEHISCLNNNINALKERGSIGYQRNLKLVKYLEKQGLSTENINNIMKLDCEIR